MEEKRAVLVTGVASYWGRRVAQRLLEEKIYRVIGIDSAPLLQELPGLDFVRAELKDPLLPELLALEDVSTVCHLAFRATRRPSESAFEHNVMGTMKLFGAAAEAGVRHIVIKSSTSVYGAYPDNPAFLGEDALLRATRSYGYNRYLLEIEAFCNGFCRQHPSITLSILRFANVVAPGSDAPFTHYLAHRTAPVLMGFNPLFQVIDADDAVEAVVHAVGVEMPGAFNVAAEPVMPLKRILALANTLPVPILHPFAGSKLTNPLFDQMYLEPDYLRYRWTADVRRMQEVLGFSPATSGDEAIRHCAGLERRESYHADGLSVSEEEMPLQLVIQLRRKRRDRDRMRASQATT